MRLPVVLNACMSKVTSVNTPSSLLPQDYEDMVIYSAYKGGFDLLYHISQMGIFLFSTLSNQITGGDR